MQVSISQPRLLRTKLYVPRVHADLVPRDRLLRRLDQGQCCRLTLVSAPAGFGKTTLLGDWLHRRAIRAAWVSLDAADNEPARFWAYVLAALDAAWPGLGQAATGLLRSPQPPPIEAILTELANEVALLDPPAQPLTLVLDDYHTIHEPAIHGAVEFLLLNLPPQMRTIVASRHEPPLPLALLRARRELVELHAADLRFTVEEAAAFFNTCMGLDLTPGDLATLEARTEGWAAGLQLAALSMQGSGDLGGFVRAFAGSHRYVLDYLAQEVLSRQAEPVREFLLQTAILDRLCGSLCDAVRRQSDGQAMLAQLEQANLFLVPLDHERIWYRYHHLFAEFLRKQLEQAQGATRVTELRRRAAAWYEQQGLIEDAVHQSLQAHDLENAIRLIEEVSDAMFVRSELVTLCGWLAALPEHEIAARPRLSMLYSWALLATGHGEQAEFWVQAVERALGAGVEALAQDDGAALAPRVQSALIELSVLRGSLALIHGDIPRVLALLNRSLPFLDAEDQPCLFNTRRALRPAALFTLAVTYELMGDLGAARQAFADAASAALEDKNHHILPMALSHLASLQTVQGHLHQAEKTYLQALEAAGNVAGGVSPLAGMAHTGLGRLLYEWNHLAAAHTHLSQGIALARPWMNWETLGPGYLALAQLNLALGDREAAAQALDALDALKQVSLPPHGASQIDVFRALMQIRSGDVEASAGWAASSDLTPETDVPHTREEEAIILARVWIAQGRQADARRLLGRLLPAVQAAGRTGRQIEILVVQAVALYHAGQPDEAAEALCQALVLAEPEGWVRTFVDAGPPLAQLLSRIDPECVPGYAARLRAAFGRPPAAAAPAPDRPISPSPGQTPGRVAAGSSLPLAEPLTDREIEVLRLMATGQSNQQIAAHLVISVNTVKTHAKSLYGKLGTANRTETVARARAIGLLPD